MTFFVSLVPLVMGFALLVKGADVFVDGASKLAVRLGVPAFVVGLTVVALGTSAPEAAMAVSSSLHAADELAISGVLGSNIINTLVILGAVALFADVPVGRFTLRHDLPFVLGTTAVMLGLCLGDGELGRADSLLLLALLGVYLWHLVRTAHWRGDATDAVGDGGDVAGGAATRLAVSSVAGMVAIAVGSNLAVTGATGLARLMGMTDRLVGLTVVALGTSLPELVTSVTAARKGQADVAIGNVVGSCILNVLFVLGLSGIIAPIPFADALLVDGVVAMASVALLWVLSVRRMALGRRAGIVLLGCYAAYLAFVLAV